MSGEWGRFNISDRGDDDLRGLTDSIEKEYVNQDSIIIVMVLYDDVILLERLGGCSSPAHAPTI